MRVILQSRFIEQIPVLEYYQEQSTHKGLVFIQHGYESTKEYGSDYLALTLARKGYFVVAIDAYKHGERIAEPYISGTAQDRLDEAFIVVKRTALDIIRIHHNAYRKLFPTFDIIGVSLGGMIAYYLATKTTHVRKLVPVISTPDFHTLARYTVGATGLNLDAYFTKDKVDFIESINPISRLHKMHYESMFIACGSHDQVVPMEPTKQFYETHKNARMTMTVYDTDHNVPRDMQLDIFSFIEQ
ncbi:alpha/beta hydrolase family protein [Candidatus Xianfuyuplasma coldseepsis]|uniref:Serine hydrolase domain-containing protein n=1 Tax=Candidatus Xianfuyuplasma coldseepsis TaxID=2782163 RepID=A0A7L7KRQ7_9MOLU|nr:hypothetical protein [Xianfuyuplasma coldseepsis]QMS85387.1 hypothetical protein G4Z02_06345 [Xianfuyuplasma coldseepsis]